MKKQLPIVVLLLCVITSSFGQTRTGSEISGAYQFTTALFDANSPQQSFLSAAPGTRTSKVNVPKDGKVTVQSVSATEVFYTYWIYDATNAGAKNTAYNANNIVFVMPKADFEKYTVPLYSKFKGANVGIYSVPFRLRGIGNDFDFESSLALQANMVFGFGTEKSKDSWFDGSFGIGLTGVNLNPDNSDVTENRTASAITFSLGGLVKVNRFANFGVFLGWDFLGAKDRPVNWKYDRKAWLGVGINISFSEISTDESADSGDQ